ncbi:respiratory chain complex I subunit 1 family protein [Azospirillum sp.]|uniref:respiratory chain complex I subunit 1 family protein n=1 Tax=Azospirillum sp. TaxID=34012 RepID=UPI002D22B0A3|nr:NADH-quinone oxidoreductase subunit H [Azospirillum sp.]HYD70971.1 NADH-quinone oxidoreductase subunit H [Azospirillum sp.]
MSVFLQIVQMALVLALAPLLTGFVRWVKSRLLGRRGAPPWQPYRDIARLLRKEVVLARNASWLFRATPYMMFTAIWLAAALVPTFTTQLALAPTADLIALIALLGSARFFLALAGMDIGTSFGGLGSSREMMIAALAEPAMLMVVFSVAILVRTTSLAEIADFMMSGAVGLRISLALALITLIMVAIAENARIPIDNPATHLELTMVHEAMVLEYSGRHLALVEGASMLKLLLYMALIACIFAPWGMATPAAGGGPFVLWGMATFVVKLAVGGVLLAVFETSIAKMRVFRYGEFLGGALLLSLLGAIFLYVSRGV